MGGVRTGILRDVAESLLRERAARMSQLCNRFPRF